MRVIKYVVDGVEVAEKPPVGTHCVIQHFLDGVLVMQIESAITEDRVAAEELHITKLAFLSRFTFDELVAIDLASIGETVEAAQVRSMMMKSKSAAYIDLSRQDTQDGVMMLAQLGIITVERATEIVTNPVEDVERPTWS